MHVIQRRECSPFSLLVSHVLLPQLCLIDLLREHKNVNLRNCFQCTVSGIVIVSLQCIKICQIPSYIGLVNGELYMPRIKVMQL